MERAQSKSILRFLARRQVILVAIAIHVSVFSSAHVPARDQYYLDAINEEAQNLGEVDNTDATANTNPTDTSASEQSSYSQSTFLQQIQSQLHSNGDNEKAYLKQLEKEVKNLQDAPDQPVATKKITKAKPQEDNGLAAEQKRVSEITETQRKEMELALEKKIPGIYRLYNKLGLTQKRLVVQEYLTNEKISTASKTILKLYSGKDPF